MRTFRILLHSLVLAGINIGSVLVGFVIYCMFRPANQIAVQVPSAMVVSIAVFLLWSLTIKRLSNEKLSLQERTEFTWTFFLALLWNPVIFIPLHYIGRGYLTSFSNIQMGWIFQIPTNIAAILAVINYAVLVNRKT